MPVLIIYFYEQERLKESFSALNNIFTTFFVKSVKYTSVRFPQKICAWLTIWTQNDINKKNTKNEIHFIESPSHKERIVILTILLVTYFFLGIFVIQILEHLLEFTLIRLTEIADNTVCQDKFSLYFKVY